MPSEKKVHMEGISRKTEGTVFYLGGTWKTCMPYLLTTSGKGIQPVMKLCDSCRELWQVHGASPSRKGE